MTTPIEEPENTTGHLQLDPAEQRMLAGPRTLTLDEHQRATFVDVLRDWGGGHGNVGTDPFELADEIDQHSRLPLTTENIEAIQSALADAGTLPAHMADVVATVAEEGAVITESRIIQPSKIEQDTFHAVTIHT